ncbi:amidohydrolase [Paraburkholderia flagellata]|uniref:amidohydrolase n=1 Tax=Paraburkholderia flagellata TaxID=2883241 RepID=UPI001F44663F|nr:amidohydrolase [Paraburkholderia flagellata]
MALPSVSTVAFATLGGASASSAPPPPTEQKIHPILKPLKINRGGKPTGFCIDVHAHIFNASDIDVVGFIRKDVGHKFVGDIERFIDGMALVAGELQNIEISAAKELGFLREIAEKMRGMSDVNIAKEMDGFASGKRDSIARDIAQAMTKHDGLIDLYKKLKREFYEQSQKAESKREPPKQATPIPGPTTFDEKTVLNAIDPARRIREYDRFTAGIPGVIPRFDPDGTFELVGHMLSYRWMNLRDYARFYTENNNAFGIDAMFASFVNFDRWLNIAGTSSQAEQMELHALLSKLSGGYMLPIVAYNPWTDIAEKDASFKLVQDAVLNHGFIGVKIYPPTGFFPYGNGSLHYPTSERHPPLDALDEKLLQMFSWCAKNNVPVMAHSAESNGRDAGSDTFGGPDGWKALLNRIGTTPPVIGSLAHFGGGESASMTAPNNWPERFAVMMASPQGKRLFGDLAFWDQMLDCSLPHDKCDVAKERLRTAFSKNVDLSKRLMFGTDWDMLSQVPRWDRYPTILVRNLRGIVLDLNAFLYENAMRCFGLENGGAQRSRVLNELSKVEGHLPEWLQFAPSVDGT